MTFVIGIDIGGTKIEGVLFDDKYRKVKLLRVHAPANTSRNEALSVIDNMIAELRIKPVKGIGVCYPSRILPGGKIAKVGKIKGLRGFRLQEYLQKKHKCKVIVANDADCFSLGEHRMGASRGATNSFGLIWGTGVGGGIIIQNKLYTSSFGSAAEVGKNVIDPKKGPPFDEGIRGAVEAYAGGKYIVNNYKRLGGRMKEPTGMKIAQSKERIAKQVMDDAINALALLLSHIQNTLCPEIIVVGGGLSNRPVYAKLNKLTKRYTHPNFRNHVRIVRNKLGDSAGVYGAASLVLGN
ncbi:MAG: ROK family protein [Candidatus Woesearchaeota archaeon]